MAAFCVNRGSSEDAGPIKSWARGDPKAWNLSYGKALELKIFKRIIGADKG